jgi:hypothetical protein
MRAYGIVLSPSQRFLNFFTPSPPSRGRRIIGYFQSSRVPVDMGIMEKIDE